MKKKPLDRLLQKLMDNHISREELEELLDSLEDEGFCGDVEKQLRIYFEKILHDFHRNN